MKKRFNYKLCCIIFLVFVFSIIFFLFAKNGSSSDEVFFIEQSVKILQNLDYKITETLSAPDNKRVLSLSIIKGTIFIDLDRDKIYYEIPTSFEYTREAEIIQSKGFNFTTIKDNNWKLIISKNYGFEMRSDNISSGLIELSSEKNYKLTVENQGYNSENKTIINFNITPDLQKDI